MEIAQEALRSGEAETLMPVEAHPDAPITARRFLSLHSVNGDDDMFSQDLTEDQLQVGLGWVGWSCCCVVHFETTLVGWLWHWYLRWYLCLCL